MGAIISFGLQGLLSFLPSSPGKVRKVDTGLAGIGPGLHPATKACSEILARLFRSGHAPILWL